MGIFFVSLRCVLNRVKETLIKAVGDEGLQRNGPSFLAVRLGYFINMLTFRLKVRKILNQTVLNNNVGIGLLRLQRLAERTVKK